jgi:hypothetical protein
MLISCETCARTDRLLYEVQLSSDAKTYRNFAGPNWSFNRDVAAPQRRPLTFALGFFEAASIGLVF